MKFDPGLEIFHSSIINDDNFFCGFTTKACGDMRIKDALHSFFPKTGLSVKTIILPEQIHSANITEFSAKNYDLQEMITLEETDGLVTREIDTALLVRTADCVPVVFADKKNRVIAVSHQGWRGSLKRLVQSMVEKLKGLGSAADDLYVCIGPSINDCCYHVDEDRYYQFLSEFNGYSQSVFRMLHGKPHVNLSRLNYLLLLESGVPDSHIDHFPFCTSCDKSRFYSFRRDHKKDYGNMMNFIVMN